MVKIILSGCNGHMGRAITACAAGYQDMRIVAGVDIDTSPAADYPVFAHASDYNGDADVIVDFSHPSALSPLLACALDRKLPIVVCTTGLSKEQVGEIHEVAALIPVFYSGNMSMGVVLMMELAKKAAAVLGDSFDIEIIEKHHNQKVDAPSGTALMLADAISSSLPEEPRYVYDRHSVRKKRDKNEIGIHAVRSGTIVGEHEIIFAGCDEILTLTHSARSKNIFAVGSINAALFIARQAPGLYSMADLVASK